MVPYYGDFPVNATVYIPINTFDSNDPCASVTATNLANTDVHIHKDGGTTQRNNAAGITMAIDYDSITGNHLLTIDTSDTTVADFYQAGHEYQVRVEGVTVDAATINAWVGCFSIERANGILALLKNATYGLAQLVRSTTPANTLTVDANHLVAVPATQKVDVDTIKTQAVTCAAGVTVLASVGTAATSTAQTGDSYGRLGAPAGASIAADLLAIDNLVDDLESRIGTPSNLGSGATVAANLVDIEGQTDDIGAAGAGLTALPAVTLAAGSITAAVIATGAIDADAIADNAIDAGAIAADAITAAKIANGAIDAATFAAGAINAAAIADAAIDNATFAADVGSTAYATNIIALAADKAIIQNNLDHLAKTATAAADMTTEVADNTILSRIIAAGDTSAFDPSTDGLQPLKDSLATEADIAAAILATPANLLVTDASGQAAANVTAVNDIAIDGAGTELDPWGPAA